MFRSTETESTPLRSSGVALLLSDEASDDRRLEEGQATPSDQLKCLDEYLILLLKIDGSYRKNQYRKTVLPDALSFNGGFLIVLCVIGMVVTVYAEVLTQIIQKDDRSPAKLLKQYNNAFFGWEKCNKFWPLTNITASCEQPYDDTFSESACQNDVESQCSELFENCEEFFKMLCKPEHESLGFKITIPILGVASLLILSAFVYKLIVPSCFADIKFDHLNEATKVKLKGLSNFNINMTSIKQMLRDTTALSESLQAHLDSEDQKRIQAIESAHSASNAAFEGTPSTENLFRL